jgi:hypothetical protein
MYVTPQKITPTRLDVIVIVSKAQSCNAKPAATDARGRFIGQAPKQGAAEHAGRADDDKINCEIGDANWRVENDEIGNRRQRYVEPEQQDDGKYLRFDKRKISRHHCYRRRQRVRAGAAPGASSRSR